MKPAIILLSILLTGCDAASDFWGASNCSDKMSDVEKSKGKSYTVNNYDSGGYHNEVWTYRSKGVAYSFTWGENVDNCDVSTYTFPAY